MTFHELISGTSAGEVFTYAKQEGDDADYSGDDFPVNAGAYTVTVALGNPNYTFSDSAAPSHWATRTTPSAIRRFS